MHEVNSTPVFESIFGWPYFLVYLSGPIDFAEDARSQRDCVTEKLVDIGFKRNQILDPCRKPALGIPFVHDNEWELLRQYRKEHNYDAMCELESQIAHLDLHLVDISSLVIVYFPKSKTSNQQIPTYGTIHELVLARQLKKPVFVVWEGGKNECSAWIMWLVKHQNVFVS